MCLSVCLSHSAFTKYTPAASCLRGQSGEQGHRCPCPAMPLVWPPSSSLFSRPGRGGLPHLPPHLGPSRSRWPRVPSLESLSLLAFLCSE